MHFSLQTSSTPCCAAPGCLTQAAMLAHRLGIDEQRFGNALGWPVVVQQQQHIHATVHRAVDLPTHHRQQVGSLFRRQYRTGNAAIESHRGASDQRGDPKNREFRVYYAHVSESLLCGE